jgi:hypothetical protein
MPQSLGNTTKFASGAEFAAEYGYTALRFWLLSVARAILPPDHRIAICWRYPLPDRAGVDVIYSDETKRARTTTMKCGQGWVCPCCTSWISERRRHDLETAIRNSRRDYIPVMLTYTMQHNKGMRLRDTLDALQASYRNLRSGRWWQEVKQEFGFMGSVRTTEITYGEAGWHPHYHELMFCDIKLVARDYAGNADEFSRAVAAVIENRWIHMLERRGYTAKAGVALTVVSTDDAVADYIAKWGAMPMDADVRGITYEIASGAQKHPKMGNWSVWDLLFAAQYAGRYKGLFWEFATATKGRSQLQWTRGLKEKLRIDEIRDEDAAQGVETESDIILATIESDMWRWIAENHQLPVLMTIANDGDADKLQAFVAHLREEREDTLDGNVHWSLGG